jgi:hypothetical protein
VKDLEGLVERREKEAVREEKREAGEFFPT